MRLVLIQRPQPGADATARRAAALGLSPVTAPLFTVRAIPWDAPDAEVFDALLITSANAVRLGGQNLAKFAHLPVFAVGEVTAQAARVAGFSLVDAGATDSNAAIGQAVSAGKRRLLHLAGREFIPLDHAAVLLERRIVYVADAVEALPLQAVKALASGAVALVHSPRAARTFAGLIDRARIERSNIRIATLSQAIVSAAGSGWGEIAAAEQPNDDALLAIAARLCDQSAAGDKTGRHEDRA